MHKPDSSLFQLQQLIIDFSLIDRNHYLAGTSRRENDSEHSLSIALLCWYIHDKYSVDLDIAKIMKYAIAHDFVEVHAGDINTFASAADRRRKVKLEEQSLQRFAQDFNQFEDMTKTMQNYEAKQDDEALFVWTVDKMQQLIMGDMDDWRPYKEVGVRYEAFCDKYDEFVRSGSPECKEMFAELVEYCKGTFYDRPNILKR